MMRDCFLFFENVKLLIDNNYYTDLGVLAFLKQYLQLYIALPDY